LWQGKERGIRGGGKVDDSRAEGGGEERGTSDGEEPDKSPTAHQSPHERIKDRVAAVVYESVKCR